MMDKKVLFFANFPPPLNGSSKVSGEIYRILSGIDSINVNKIDSTLSSNLKEINGYNYNKVSKLLSTLKQLYLEARRCDYDILYLALNTNFVGMAKIFFALISRLS